jgi:hypothetical protein
MQVACACLWIKPRGSYVNYALNIVSVISINTKILLWHYKILKEKKTQKCGRYPVEKSIMKIAYFRSGKKLENYHDIALQHSGKSCVPKPTTIIINANN